MGQPPSSDRIFRSLERQVEDPDGIEDLVDWAVQIGDQDRVVLAMWKERHTDPNSQQESRQRLTSQLADALAELTARGIIRHYHDTKALAALILAVVRRLIMSYAIFEDENITELKAGATEFMQHALFEDVALAASRLYKRQQERGN